MEYVSPEYEKQLQDLARLLCPQIGHVAVAPDYFGDYHQIESPRNRSDEAPGGRWDSMGNYYVPDDL